LATTRSLGFRDTLARVISDDAMGEISFGDAIIARLVRRDKDG